MVHLGKKASKCFDSLSKNLGSPITCQISCTQAIRFFNFFSDLVLLSILGVSLLQFSVSCYKWGKKGKYSRLLGIVKEFEFFYAFAFKNCNSAYCYILYTVKNNLKLLLHFFVFRYHSAKVGFLRLYLTNSVFIEF